MRKFLLLVLLAALVVAPVIAQDEGPPAMGIRPDAPPYAVHGPYWVGTMNMVIDEGGERPLPVTVWYPALNPEGAEESVIYETIMKWVPMPEGAYIVHGHALRDAAPDSTNAPYPLIVFSHGFSMSPGWSAFLLEHLASYGFVVIGPDHSEYSYFEGAQFRDAPRAVIQRPQDITLSIDFAEDLNENSEVFAGVIDTDQVAVAGASAGGLTTLIAGGARFDYETYKTRCADPDNPPPLCDTYATEDANMAQYAGLEAPPEGLWPSWSDPRVKAVIPMAGDTHLFGEAGLAPMTLPMLAIGGTMDMGVPFDWGSRFAYENAGSPRKTLVGLEGGNHYLFQASCAEVPWLIDMGFFWFCSDSVWDMDRAHDLVNHFTTAFLLAELYGDEDARAALAPDAVAFPGIGYEAVGY